MREGDFENAWLLSDAVLKSRAGKSYWHLPRHFQPIWNGEPLNDKTVLVRCYHGLGDTIQFTRFMPLLKSIAKKVIVWAQPELLGLLHSVTGIDQLLPLHNGTPEVAYDAEVEIMELTHVFRSTIETIGAKIPYLEVEPLQLSKENKFSVGLVWKAGNWDEKRNIPFTVLSPLAKITGIQLYVMQANVREAGWQEGFGVYPGEFDLDNYARVLRGLNLLITVDSMPAHLAGAMGVPVWTLLPAEADWRWMEKRQDSPWYPSMRLFRQSENGNWEKVIEVVVEELKRLVAGC